MDNNTNNSQTNVSFLDDKQSVSFHIKDLVFLLLRNIHWLIIFALLGGVIANLYTRRQEKIYESNAKILIRSGNDVGVADNNMREMSIRTTLGLQSFYSSTLYNEMMILTSKTTIRKAVEDLHLNIVYSTHTRFTHRDKDLYGISPVEIEMADDDFPLPNRLVITILDEGHALLDGGVSASIPIEAALHDGIAKNIIVLTRDRTYVKKNKPEFPLFYLKHKYKAYPALVEAIRQRPAAYERQRNLCYQEQERENALVIEPSRPINIKRQCRDVEMLEDIYRMGVADANARLVEINRFLAMNQ